MSDPEPRPRVDHLDLSIIHALQVNPRAPWTLVSQAVRMDPVTVARRWERLETEGIAWTTIHPIRELATTNAIVALECESSAQLEIGELLSGDAEAFSIDVTASGADLLVSVLTRSFRELSDYITHRLGALDGVRRVRAHIALRAYTEGSRWRVGELTRSQVAMLETRLVEGGAPTGALTRDEDWELALALAPDARRSPRELGEITGLSEATARRRLTRLLEAGNLRLRCDMAREMSGSPVASWFFCRVNATRLDAVGQALRRIPQVRAIHVVDSRANLLVQTWLPALAHVQDLETRMEAAIGDLDVVDRFVVLRTLKRFGRVLGEDGRSIRTVVSDLRSPSWARTMK